VLGFIDLRGLIHQLKLEIVKNVVLLELFIRKRILIKVCGYAKRLSKKETINLQKIQEYQKIKKKQYQKHPKAICVMCGFIPEDPCQIDIDHIDGNHKNNNKDNFQALCANCHRLKTKKNKEGIYKNTTI
jgi:hypothetical protein